jgi:surface antigen
MSGRIGAIPSTSLKRLPASLRLLAAGGVAALAMGAPHSALGAAASTTHPLPAGAPAGLTTLCGPSAGYSCTTGGYDGTAGQIAGNGWAPWQYWQYGSPVGSVRRHNCTTYAAYKLQRNGVAFPGWTADAKDWDTKAQAAGTRVDQTPAIGAIAQWNGGGDGHVAYVESVSSSSIEITDDSYGANTTSRRRIGLTSGARPDNYIHFKDLVASVPTVSRYANTLVRWTGDGVTTWFVTPDMHRLWIPDAATNNQLQPRGYSGPYSLSGTTLKGLPDMVGHWVAGGATWKGNRTLRRGMSVRSADGRYLFAMQDDGNLVLYGPTRRALWATSWKTASWQRQEYVVFQGDGNLVTYGGGRAIWASNTAGTGADRFVVQSDGNLVIYRGSRWVWQSYTAGRS